jgi:hypothetical protein
MVSTAVPKFAHVFAEEQDLGSSFERAAVTDDNLELVTDVLGAEVMHLGAGQWREVVVHHEDTLSHLLKANALAWARVPE